MKRATEARGVYENAAHGSARQRRAQRRQQRLEACFRPRREPAGAGDDRLGVLEILQEPPHVCGVRTLFARQAGYPAGGFPQGPFPCADRRPPSCGTRRGRRVRGAGACSLRRARGRTPLVPALRFRHSGRARSSRPSPPCSPARRPAARAARRGACRRVKLHGEAFRLHARQEIRQVRLQRGLAARHAHAVEQAVSFSQECEKLVFGDAGGSFRQACSCSRRTRL